MKFFANDSDRHIYNKNIIIVYVFFKSYNVLENKFTNYHINQEIQ